MGVKNLWKLPVDNPSWLHHVRASASFIRHTNMMRVCPNPHPAYTINCDYPVRSIKQLLTRTSEWVAEVPRIMVLRTLPASQLAIQDHTDNPWCSKWCDRCLILLPRWNGRHLGKLLGVQCCDSTQTLTANAKSYRIPTIANGYACDIFIYATKCDRLRWIRMPQWLSQPQCKRNQPRPDRLWTNEAERMNIAIHRRSRRSPQHHLKSKTCCELVRLPVGPMCALRHMQCVYAIRTLLALPLCPSNWPLEWR